MTVTHRQDPSISLFIFLLPLNIIHFMNTPNTHAIGFSDKAAMESWPYASANASLYIDK